MVLRARRSVLAALCAASVGACFPDEKLNPADASIDAVSDLGNDLGVEDAPSIDARDAAPDDAPVTPPDAAPDDVPVTPPDAGRCASLPRGPLPAMTVYDRLPDATYLAFDGAGQVAVASLRDVISIGAMGARSLLFTALPGNVTALRFTAAGELVMALVPATMDGTLGGGAPGEGAIYVAPSGDAGAPSYRAAAARPGGLAVDSEGAVWFSDTARNRVFRMTARAGDGGVDVAPMITDVTAPTWLAFDQTGRTLYVASSAMGGSLLRVVLSRTVLGDLMPSDAVGLARDLGGVSGLAVDACDNVYVADETAGRVVRLAEPWTDVAALVTDAPGARSLAFGQGGTFDADTLFFVSSGAVRAASVGAPGVALPVPAR